MFYDFFCLREVRSIYSNTIFGSNKINRYRHMNANRQIINDFLLKTAELLSPTKTLVLNFSKPNVIDIKIDGATEIKSDFEFSLLTDNKFDLIIGDLPFGMQPVQVDTASNLKVNKNWSFLLYSLRTLSENGKAFFLVEPSILFSQQGKKYLQDLSLENYFVNAVFELPEKLLYPETSFQPIIIGFETTQNIKLFIGEVTLNYETLSEHYLQKSNGDNLSDGLIVDRTNFDSFNKFRIETEIDNLKTQYKDYTKYSLSEIATEINLSKNNFEDKPNSIYIPKIGNSQVVSNTSSTTLKHQNYFQVVLDEHKVKAEFLTLFYHSELGKLILKSLPSGSFIPNINKSDILTSFVAIPKLEEQDLLILTNQKLSALQETINQLKKELSLNPKNAGVILDKFESIQSPLKQLSEEDLILSLIRKGENKHIEFKETFSKNVQTGQKDKVIEKSSLKNIVGFLNADGGSLIIGVADNGTIKGIEDDFFQNADRYKLNFKNALNTKIGSEFYPLIDYDLFTVNGKVILKVECKASSNPCFYGEIEFYVRTNPATDRLEGKKQVDYIRTRFK